MPAATDVTLRDALAKLWSDYHLAPWFCCVGEGETCGDPAIILYVTKAPKDLRRTISGGWHGYSVQIKEVGGVGPANG